MELNNIIIKPHHTEKSYRTRKFQDPSCLVFVVNRSANKNDVRRAFVEIYNVNPEKINVVNRKPQAIRTGTATPGYSKWLKLAYITLPKGTEIALTRDEIEEAAKQMHADESASKKVKKEKTESEEKTAEPKAKKVKAEETKEDK
ncbi:MAG: 50S ribosomal protein L23 [Mycoplasma sp.]